MLVKARAGLLNINLTPIILGKINKKIDWYRDVFDCNIPKCLNGQYFDIVLKNHKFEKGIAFARSSDFDCLE